MFKPLEISYYKDEYFIEYCVVISCDNAPNYFLGVCSQKEHMIDCFYLGYDSLYSSVFTEPNITEEEGKHSTVFAED